MQKERSSASMEKEKEAEKKEKAGKLVCLAALDVFWNVAACSSER